MEGSCFCDKCQPKVNQGSAPVRAHAYYLAALDQTFGDPEMGKELRNIFKQWYGDLKAHRVDGVSHWDYGFGTNIKLCVKDFFNPKPEAFIILPIG